MYGHPPPQARQVTHLLIGAILCAGLAIVSLIFGGLKVLEAVDNPAPKQVRCEEGALRSVGIDTWVELDSCGLDIGRAFKLVGERSVERFYIPLVVPESGALVGVFETHDTELLFAIANADHYRTVEAGRAVATRLETLLSEPRRGFTAKAGYGEQGIFRHLPEFGPADVLLEHGREPKPVLGLASVVMGFILLVCALLLALRVRRAWAADAADLAAWRARHHPPASHP